MKVLHVVGASEYGGGSVVVMDLAAAARDAGHEASVLASNPRFVEALRDRNIDVVSHDGIIRPIRPISDMRDVVRLALLLRRLQPDIVHTHTSKAGAIGRLAARLAQVPGIVHTVHGFPFHEQTPPLPRAIYRKIETMFGRLSDSIVLCGEHLRQEAVSLGASVERRLVSIPNGIVPPAPDPLVEMPAVWTSGPSELLKMAFVGRLSQQKGADVALRALALIVERTEVPARLALVGDGEERGALEALAADLHLQGVVEFLGFRPNAAGYVAAADCAVFPSRWEGLSIAILEAIQIGTPVLLSDIPANRELNCGTDAPRYFRVDDPQSLADSILDHWRARHADREAAAALSAVSCARHSRERMCNEYLRLYQQILDRKMGLRSE